MNAVCSRASWRVCVAAGLCGPKCQHTHYVCSHCPDGGRPSPRDPLEPIAHAATLAHGSLPHCLFGALAAPHGELSLAALARTAALAAKAEDGVDADDSLRMRSTTSRTGSALSRTSSASTAFAPERTGTDSTAERLFDRLLSAAEPEAVAPNRMLSNMPTAGDALATVISASQAPVGGALVYESIVAEMQQRVRSTAGMLALGEDVVQQLLYVSDWSLRRLQDVLAADAAQVLVRAGLPADALGSLLSAVVVRTAAETGMVACAVCTEEYDASTEGFGLACGHQFCRACWARHIDSCVSENRGCTIRCMQGGTCGLVLLQSGVDALASADARERIQTALCRSFIDRSATLRCCKNPRGCNAVVVVEPGRLTATCSHCSFEFCLACDLPAHEPATCDMMRQWVERGGYVELSAEETETRRLKALTTSPCPKCGYVAADPSPVPVQISKRWGKRLGMGGGVGSSLKESSAGVRCGKCATNPGADVAGLSPAASPLPVQTRHSQMWQQCACSVSIEKNEGCNHMDCANCKYKFCWICMSEYTRTGCGSSRCNVKKKISNAFVDFAEANKHCANHGVGRSVALKLLQKLVTADKAQLDVAAAEPFIGACKLLAECRSLLLHTIVRLQFNQPGSRPADKAAKAGGAMPFEVDLLDADTGKLQARTRTVRLSHELACSAALIIGWIWLRDSGSHVHRGAVAVLRSTASLGWSLPCRSSSSAGCPRSTPSKSGSRCSTFLRRPSPQRAAFAAAERRLLS